MEQKAEKQAEPFLPERGNASSSGLTLIISPTLQQVVTNAIVDACNRYSEKLPSLRRSSASSNGLMPLISPAAQQSVTSTSANAYNRYSDRHAQRGRCWGCTPYPFKFPGIGARHSLPWKSLEGNPLCGSPLPPV